MTSATVSGIATEAVPTPTPQPTTTAGPERDVTRQVEVEVHRLARQPVEAIRRDPITEYRVLLGPCEGESPTHGHQGQLVVWHPDGDEIVFSAGADIYAIGPTGQRLRVLAADPATSTSLMTGFSVAPDGEHLVYATCQFPAPPTEYTRSINADPTFEFELALRPMARGGWTPQRLTTNWVFDHFPTWSPDGTRIAFLRSRQGSIPGSPRSPTALMVMAADGTDEHVAPHSPGLLIHHPPAWSPDGTRLAVARHATSKGTGLWLVDADGETATHLTAAVSGAAWSPDGKRVAFAKADGDDVGLYTIAADGTDERRVTTIEAWWPQSWAKRYGEPDASRAWIETVAWAPDGALILVRANAGSGVVVIGVDGQARVEIAVPMTIAGEAQAIAGFWAAAWAPDGRRIALLGVDTAEQPMLVTTTPDGSDPQLLTRASPAWGVPQATGGGAPVGPVGAAACRAGIVVPDPARQPGLVADCEALLALRDRSGDAAGLNWREDLDRPLPSWEGLILGGTPPRVTELHVGDRDLRGSIPTELVLLSELESIYLAGNDLTGPIPAELAQLHKLRYLGLHGNSLTGPIPEELGQLTELRYLLLHGNPLTGPIPETLGQLANLKELWLVGNQLSGPIPPALGQLANLESLNLSLNQLSGPIPVEFGQLRNLRSLILSRNQLSGPIPPELGQLDRLGWLEVHDNPWTGCIPRSLERLIGSAGLGLPLCRLAE